MLSRLPIESSAAFFTIVAFIFASAIFISIAWRAIRMKPVQVERFESLPFETETPAAVRIPQSDFPNGTDTH